MTEKFKHSFQKKWGQNFLRNDRFAKLLVEAANISAEDVVVEIGPGDGRVTNLLLATGAKVLAIEVDYSLLANLIKRFGNNENFQLINKNILETDVISELEKLGWGNNFKVVGSLPYNISKIIIERLITNKIQPQICSFIVQEEVAQDYSAKLPKASFLSNWVQLYADVKKLESIPKSQFVPAPKVNGGILQIIPHKKYSEEEIKEISKIIRVAFSNPRKTLWNNLRNIEPFKLLTDQGFYTKYQVDNFLRPAEVAFDFWFKLSQHN